MVGNGEVVTDDGDESGDKTDDMSVVSTEGDSRKIGEDDVRSARSLYGSG